MRKKYRNHKVYPLPSRQPKTSSNWMGWFMLILTISFWVFIVVGISGCVYAEVDTPTIHVKAWTLFKDIDFSQLQYKEFSVGQYKSDVNSSFLEMVQVLRRLMP